MRAWVGRRAIRTEVREHPTAVVQAQPHVAHRMRVDPLGNEECDIGKCGKLNLGLEHRKVTRQSRAFCAKGHLAIYREEDEAFDTLRASGHPSLSLLSRHYGRE